ncbi:MAG TPA: cupin domain-containing protein [Acidobacteriaceae bacterium]|nr:cupin domain-containing protein [Acidobacteriaceae bacterium]
MDRYNWDNVPREELTPLITRQVIHTPSLTMLRIHFRKGAVLPMHHHVHDQLTTVLSGRLRLESEGNTVELGPGELARMGSDVPHAVEALEDTIAVDVFTPARTDWQ